MTLSPGPDAEVFLSGRFDSYRDARCLVTGGMGFIGSNIVRVLVALGARVTVVDHMAPEQGGNAFNLADIAGAVSVLEHDIGDEPQVAEAVRGQDYVFNLAGKSSHVDSLESPFYDMETNVRGQLVLLEAVRQHAPGARVVFASTRSVYGAIQTSPVAEDHPVLPTEVNSANKGAADLYHIAYWHAHGISTASLRLTNIYGPRMLMGHSRQGFINWFVRLALEGGEFRLYGDGSQLRDLVYVDDTVEAFLAAGLQRDQQGVAFNIGSGNAASLREIAQTLVEITGRGSLSFVPFPEEAKRIEIGDYVADTTRSREGLGWQARTDLRRGLEATCAYYEAHRSHYW